MTGQDLRNSILQLAIQGKLVEQREEEGTAVNLIEKIQAEKEQWVKEGRIKREKSLPMIADDETPFVIPETWEWIRFGDLGSYRKGPFGSALTKAMFVPKGNDTVKVYEQKNAIQKDATLGDYYIPRQYFESKMKGFELFPGDIIVSCAGTIGETYVMPEQFQQGIINQALMRMKIVTQMCVDFFLIYFDFILKKTARLSSKGSAIKNIPPFAELKSYLVPLPPLEEQRRIVAKIEELMPYVDQYDKVHSEVEELNSRFPSDMEKSILQYAIQGKLVEQREEKGTAEELYHQIREERKRLVTQGALKRQKALPDVTEDEIPFEIPENWKWVRLNDLADACEVPFADGPFGSNLKNIHYVDNSEVRIIQLSNIGQDGWRNESKRYTSYKHAETIARSKVKAGDIVIAKMMPAGRAIEVPDVETEFVLSSDAVKFVPHYRLNKHYLLYAINSSVFRSQVYAEVQGITRVRTSLTKVKTYLVPLPPLEEQKRIVAKIEELMPYVDQYDKVHSEVEELNSRFPCDMEKSILQYAIQGKLVEQREEEGTAEELYEQIQDEKKRLVKEGKIKKQKALPEIVEDEIPFEIPESWKWVTFGSISINRDHERIPLSVSQRIPLEKIYDYYGASGVIDKVDRYLFDKKLLLIGEDGANLLMRSKPIAFLAEGKYWVNNHAHVIDFGEQVYMEYVMHYINAISLAKYVTGTAQPKMNQAKLNSIPVPLPPLEEQKRIVAKIEQLMQLVDRLRTSA